MYKTTLIFKSMTAETQKEAEPIYGIVNRINNDTPQISSIALAQIIMVKFGNNKKRQL